MTKETKGNNNRFALLQAWCPRCGQDVVVDKFIVNSLAALMLPAATFACPNCADVVQVLMQGESIENSSARKTAK